MPVVVHSPEHSSWVRYDRPAAVFETHLHADVPGLLEHVESEVERTGLHAAGFLAYEAGFAFDPAMPAASSAPFPLLWFGLYPPPRPVSIECASPCPALDWAAEEGETAHAHALARIRDHLAAGETYQVNYTHRLRAPFTGDAWALFCHLLARQPSIHGAYADTGDFEVCCASPEMFFHRDGELVFSRPMKGTAQRGRWPSEDRAMADRLVASEKERAENVMIVDMVRNDLGRICAPGSVIVPELFRAERYPTLWQLTSLVQGRTTESTARVIAALFPAASITGAPKVRTMHLIREIEASPRRIYTGTLGVMLPGRRARFNVAIRTVLVDKRAGQAEFGVGGGIVWDSDPRSEFRETLLKARVLHAPAPDFSLLETMRWSRLKGIYLLEEHLDRLAESAAYFDFPIDMDTVRLEMERTVRVADGERGLLRLTADRDGSFALERRPLPPSSPCRVALARTPVDSRDPFLFHKTTLRSVYERARAEAQGMDDALLFNERGEVTEATIANLVAELDGELVTPPLDSGLLPGTLRTSLLRRGCIRERVIRVQDLPRCTRLWLINSVRGWRRTILASPSRA